MSSAFVIMPFARSFDRVYAELIKPACAAAGVAVHRADEITRQRNVIRDLVSGLALSDVIIADLSTNSANVFYELGAAHTLLRPVIVLTQDISTVAFDLRLHRVIQYQADDLGRSRDALVQALVATEGVEVETSNPIGDFIPPPVLFKLLQANRRLRPIGRLHLFRRGQEPFLRVEGDVWKGLVFEPSYELLSVNWGGSGSSWGWAGHDALSVPLDSRGVTLGPLPVTPPGDFRCPPSVRTAPPEVAHFDLYTWTITPEVALMQVEVAQQGSVHRSAVIDVPLIAIPEEPDLTG